MSKKRLTLAVDFDDTISVNNQWPKAGPPIKGVRDALTRLIPNYEIVIYTCRLNLNTENRSFHVTEIEQFMEKHQLPYDRIDMGLEGKIHADFYVDNRAIAFENNWDEISEALDKALF